MTKLLIALRKRPSHLANGDPRTGWPDVDREWLPTTDRLSGPGAGEIGFADFDRAGGDQSVMLLDPLAVDEFEDRGFSIDRGCLKSISSRQLSWGSLVLYGLVFILRVCPSATSRSSPRRSSKLRSVRFICSCSLRTGAMQKRRRTFRC